MARKSPWAVLRVVLFNLLLFVLLTEGALRLASHAAASPLLSRDTDRSATRVWRGKLQQVPGRLRFGFPVNSRSYYDDELPDTESPDERRPLVVMIGDSFSFGVVPHHFHFSTVCERRLALAVVDNVGLPAIGPFEYLHLLENEVLALKPDLVVVNLFVGNDVTDATASRRANRAERPSWDPDNFLLYLLPKRLAEIYRQGLTVAEAGTVSGEDLERRIDDPAALVEAYPWLGDRSLEKPTLLPEKFLAVETRRASAACDPRRSGYEALFEALDAMLNAVPDTRFLVQIIPDEFQVDDGLWQGVTQASRRRGLVRDLPQQRIGQWLDERNVPYLDLLPEMRRRCAGGEQRRCYHLRDTHWNARGNRIAGEAMARFLELELSRTAPP